MYNQIIMNKYFTYKIHNNRTGSLLCIYNNISHIIMHNGRLSRLPPRGAFWKLAMQG